MAMLADYLRRHIADQGETPMALAHSKIVDCHGGYHECPDEDRRPLQVFEYECPTLLALTLIYGRPDDNPA